MLVLIGVLLVIVGFLLRINPLVVVVVAGIATGLLGGMSPVAILNAFGEGFANSRSVTIFIVVLPVVGLIERFGLQVQARRLIARLARLTPGRILALYMVIRQVTSAVGLYTIAGHPQTVRPLIYPMVLGSAERRYGPLTEKIREKLKGHSAGTDNVGAFFGEDIFVAVGSILLITGFVDSTYHLTLDALSIALWAIPTGLCALLLQCARMLWLDRQLARMTAVPAGAAAQASRPEPSTADRTAPVTPGTED
jgi:uncharacterized membrane protein